MEYSKILKRIDKLEQVRKCIPEVVAIYADGATTTYKGAPLCESFFDEVNPIIKTYGSEFAELLNAIINPVENRYLENYEKMR